MTVFSCRYAKSQMSARMGRMHVNQFRGSPKSPRLFNCYAETFADVSAATRPPFEQGLDIASCRKNTRARALVTPKEFSGTS